jgi:ribosomal protein S18 acetylase RimI-like enzyme
MKQILETTAIELWQALNAKVVTLEHATCMLSGLPSPFFNRVIVCERSSEENFLNTLEFADSTELPYSLLLPDSLSISQAALQAILKEQFVAHCQMTSMCLQLQDYIYKPEESQVVIRQVSTSIEMQTMLDIWQESFTVDSVTHALHVARVLRLFEEGSLPFRFYLGYIDDKPVGSGWLLLGAKDAGIYNIGTRRVARKRGVATHMMHRLLSEAKEEGYTCAVLTALPEAKGIYERLGFQSLKNHTVYLPTHLMHRIAKPK